MSINKRAQRQRRKRRIRQKVKGTVDRPRVSVFRSQRYLYVQFIDDSSSSTLFGISDRSAKIEAKNKVERAKKLGEMCAAYAKKHKIKSVVFDRSGYKYHGRVKALVQGLRSGKLQL